MNRFMAFITRWLIAASLYTLAVTVSAPAYAAGSREILWDIVSNCIDPGAADYCTRCSWPRAGTKCAEELVCKQTTEVWSETDQFVAIRDRKMCGCPADFVHGLVIPRSRVTGVEDPRRPDGIWGFAWETALQRLGPGPETALAVNPTGNRAQDQLHVHIARLQKDARERFAKSRVVRVANLDDIWREAGRAAAAAGLADYGVLVTTHPEGGFLIVVGKESMEKTYLVERCK